MENEFKALDAAVEHEDTVLSFTSSTSSMFKTGQFASAVKDSFLRRGLDELFGKLNPKGVIPRPGGDSWLSQGVDCEILKPGKSWQKGKVRIRISLEFCPDDPVGSPLDDIRQTQTRDSQ
jgi:hypothetical protein